MKERLIEADPGCDAENILTDPIYKEFFRSMLEDNKGKLPAADEAIDELLAQTA